MLQSLIVRNPKVALTLAVAWLGVALIVSLNQPVTAYIKPIAGSGAKAGLMKAYSLDEKPTFVVETGGLVRQAGDLDANNELKAQKGVIKTQVKREDGRPVEAVVAIDSGVTNDTQFTIQVSTEKLLPGKSTVTVELSDGRQSQVIEQDFTWGVLAFNTDQSTYEVGEQATFGIGVLDDLGKTVCDAKVSLLVRDPKGQERIFTTGNNDIKIAPTCANGNVTNSFDYFAVYTPSEWGEYYIRLNAETANGPRYMEASFHTAATPKYVTRRPNTSMRIFPAATYTVNVEIDAYQKTEGVVRERVPSGFEISQISSGGRVAGAQGDRQIIEWPVNLPAGQTTKLSYTYKAPLTSPEFYLLGQLEIIEVKSVVLAESLQKAAEDLSQATPGTEDEAETLTDEDEAIKSENTEEPSQETAETEIQTVRAEETLVYTEPRPWQIASDVATSITGTVTSNEAGTIWSRCLTGTTNIRWAINGVSQTPVSCSATTGVYTIAAVTNSLDDNIVIWMDDAVNTGDKGAVYLKPDSSAGICCTATMTNINLILNRVRVRASDQRDISNANIDVYDQTGHAKIPVNVTSSNAVVDSGYMFIILAPGGNAHKYLPGGNLTVDKLRIIGTYDGAANTLTLPGSGSGACNVDNVATIRPLCIDGGSFTTASGHTTKFTGTSTLTVEATTYQNLDLIPTSGSPSYSYVAGTVTVNQTATVGNGTNAVTLNAETNDPTQTYSGNFVISAAATYSASSSATTNFAGDFTNSGVLTSNSGTLTFTQTLTKTINGSLTGSNAFNNLTFAGSGARTFNANADLNGTFTVNASTGTVTLPSALGVGGNWSVSSTSTTMTHNSGTVTFTSTTSGKTIATGGTGSGKNFNNIVFNGTAGEWTIQTNSFLAEGNLTVIAGTLRNSSVSMTVNGNVECSGTCGTITITGGIFTHRVAVNRTFGTNVASSSVDWTFNDLVFQSSTGTPTVTINSSGTGSIIASSLATGNSGTSFTLSNPSRVLDINGIVDIGSSTTLVAASGSTEFTVAGNWINNGTFTHNNGTVTFDGIAGVTRTVTPGSSNFYNVKFNGANQTTSLLSSRTNTMVVENDLSVIRGTFGTSGDTADVEVRGNVQCETTCGIVNFVGSGRTFAHRVAAGKNFGTNVSADSTAWTFLNLTFSNSNAGSSSPVTVTVPTAATGGITISGVLRIGAASGDTSTTSLNSGNRTWTLSGTGGNPLVIQASPAATLVPNTVSSSVTSTFNYTGNNTGGNTSIQSATYYKLQLNNGSETFDAGGALVAENDLTVTAGTLALAANNLTVGHTNVTSSGTISVAGTLTQTAGTSSVRTSSGSTSPTIGGAGSITFFNLTIDPSVASAPTIKLGAAAAQTINVTNDLLVGNATDSVIVDANTNDVVLNVDRHATIQTNATLQASNTAAFTVAANWTNNGTFTHNSGTVTFDGSVSGNKTINQGSSNFYQVIFNGGGGSWSAVSNTLILEDSLTMTAGTLDNAGGSVNIEARGNVVGTAGVINQTAGTFTHKPTGANKTFGTTSGATNWTFNNLTFANDGSARTSTANAGTGTIEVKSLLTIDASTTLAAGARTYLLTGTNTPFVINGTFTVNTSTISYEHSSSANATAATYYNLRFRSPTAATPTYVLNSGTFTVNNDLIIDRVGTGNPTVNANTNNPNVTLVRHFTLTLGTFNASPSAQLNVGGNWSVSTSSVFNHNSGTVTFNGTSGSKTIDTGGSAFSHARIDSASPGTATWTIQTNAATIVGDLLVVSGTLGATTDVTVNGHVTCSVTCGTITMTSGTFYRSSANKTFGTTTGSNDWAFFNLNLENSTGSPVTVTAESGGTGKYAVTGTFTLGKATDSQTTTLDANTNDRVWDVNDVTITSKGILQASNSAAFTVAGNWTNSGTFTHNSGTTTFDAASGSKTINNGSSNFNNVRFDSASPGTGAWSFQTNNATLVGDMLVVAGTVDSTVDIFVSGHVTCDVTCGIINMTAGTFYRASGNKNFGTTTGANDWTFHHLNLENSSGSPATITANGGGTGKFIITGTITVGKDSDSQTTTLDANTNDRVWDVAGGVVITSKGILQASSSAAFTVAGSWTNNGTFTHNSGTVTFDATASGKTITQGASNFNNLTFNGSGGVWSAATNTLVVENDLTMTAGTLNNSNGTAGVEVRGNVAGSAGVISFTTTGHTFEQRTVANKNFGTTSGSTAWTFQNLTFSNSNGSVTPTTITTQTGGTGGITVNEVLRLARAGDTSGATTTLKAGNRNWTLANSDLDRPFVKTASLGFLTPDSSTFTYSGNNASGDVIIATTYFNLTIGGASPETYLLAEALIVQNDLTINANGTLDVSTSNYQVNIGGNYANSGTFTARSGTVIFDATATGKTLSGTLNGASAFYNLTFNGSGGGWSNSAAMLVSNDLTVTAGTLSGTNNVTVSGGDATGNGTINLTGGTFLLDGTGNFGGTANWTFFNLTFGDGVTATATTATSTSTITVSDTLSVGANQTLNAGSKTWLLTRNGGTPFAIGASALFTPNTSTFEYRPSGTATTTVTSTIYHKITFNKASTIFNLAACVNDCTANGGAGGFQTNDGGDVAITAGQLDVTTSNYPIKVGGSWDNDVSAALGTQGFNPRSGKVTFNFGGESSTESINIFGHNNWNSLSIASPGTSDKTVVFQASMKQHINATGFIHLKGNATHRLKLNSSLSGTRWLHRNLAPAVLNQSANYLTVTDGGCDTLDSPVIITANLSDNGGNTSASCWTFTNLEKPEDPYELRQLRTDNSVIPMGGWTNETSGGNIIIKFQAKTSHPSTNDGREVRLCVEKKVIGTNFATVDTQSECGSFVDTGGANEEVIVDVTINPGTQSSVLADQQQYHWKAKVQDNAGVQQQSAFVVFPDEDPLNTDPADRDFGTDTTPPVTTAVVVRDIHNADTDAQATDRDQNGDGSLSQLSANWTGFDLGISGLLRYEYSVGTTAGATNIKGWTNNGTATVARPTGLSLQTGQSYFFNVRAVDNALNTSAVVSSNGQFVTPTLTFSLSTTAVTFANLNDSNKNNPAAQDITLTTSTNALNGYEVKAYQLDLLALMTFTIPRFQGGTYSAPGTWPSGASYCTPGTNCGFGYTSNDTAVGSGQTNLFVGATKYAPYAAAGPGDIVADRTSNTIGLPSNQEQFVISNRVAAELAQEPGTYTTYVMFTVTPKY